MPSIVVRALMYFDMSRQFLCDQTHNVYCQLFVILFLLSAFRFLFSDSSPIISSTLIVSPLIFCFDNEQ